MEISVRAAFPMALLAALVMASPPLVAQDDEAAAAEEAPDAGAVLEGTGGVDEADQELIEEILTGDEEVLAGGGYTYDPAGRRDPFLSLLTRTQLEAGEKVRPPGVPGLLIDELDVKGIFELTGQMFAQVQTADKEKSFLIQVGDQLYDGEVVNIAMNEVTFKQIVNDPSIIKPFREVVKKLNPEP